MSDAAPYDVAAVAALGDEVLDERHRAVPPSLWGLTVADVRALRPPLAELPTSVLTLDRGTLNANRDAVQAWCAGRGLGLAPHGKTTMAPQLWAEQLDAGAWGITVATAAQLAVARRFGVRRVVVANELLSPPALRWLAEDLAAHPDVEVVCWADSLEAVALMDAALAGAPPAPTVLVELGHDGARTGARDLETALAVARAVDASPALRLGGVGGYEGVVASGAGASDLAAVRGYVEGLCALHERLDAEGAYDALRAGGRRPLVTCGGSAYPDVVADVLAPLVGGDDSDAEVVLRSGASLVHDDGHYEGLSPFGGHGRGDGPRLRVAMHAWARVLSQPEPGLALADAGKRDVPSDLGLPSAQLRRARPGERGAVRLEGVRVTALADQHTFLRWDPGTPAPVSVGDVVRLGLSHPCTAFDRWSLIPVVDDADADDPVVVDLVRTFF